MRRLSQFLVKTQLTISSKIKLSHDPNNTKWSRDTAGFGHKIMRSQGWTPGEYLGAKDAAHAEFHTAANASHIRVIVKDDNLGLGAKRGSGQGPGECTGLDVFQGLLSRLNGKDEAIIAQEQKSREDLKRAIYTERKWGMIRFVPGGVLVGDKIQDLIDGEAQRLRQLDSGNNGAASGTSSDNSSSSESEDEAENTKKSQKEMKRKRKAVEGGATESARPVKESKKKRKVTESSDVSDKAARKEKKAKRREEKENRRKGSSKGELAEEKKARKEKKSKRRKEEAAKAAAAEAPSVVIVPGPQLQGRHAVRARNIAQKRLAHMDLASLNQVNNSPLSS